MPYDPVMNAAIAEYDNSFNFPYWNLEERMAARAAVRGLMVRLGRYDEFCVALDVHEGRSPDAMP